LSSGKALLYGARKTNGVARGAVGVMTYYIPGIYFTLAVMFSVPYDYNWYENWWNVKLYVLDRTATSTMFNDMYSDKSGPFKGDDKWHSKDLGQGLKFKGFMSSSGKAKLEIHVSKS